MTLCHELGSAPKQVFWDNKVVHHTFSHFPPDKAGQSLSAFCLLIRYLMAEPFRMHGSTSCTYFCQGLLSDVEQGLQHFWSSSTHRPLPPDPVLFVLTQRSWPCTRSAAACSRLTEPRLSLNTCGLTGDQCRHHHLPCNAMHGLALKKSRNSNDY